MNDNEKIEELRKKVNTLEARVEELENLFRIKKEVPQIEESFKGLNGGMRLLIKNKFLDTPKSLNEIHDELRRLGYHYSNTSVSKALLIDFMRNWRLLTRIQEDKVWKYAVKK